jgi:hypothetical protein
MKYLILAYASQQDFDALMGRDSGRLPVPADELAAIDEFLAKFTGALTESGELLDAQGLAAPVLARRVQLKDGTQVVTDGPFAETEEVLAGYWLVDCASFDRATEIAAWLNECPGPVTEHGTVIRPLLGPEEESEPAP